MTLELAATLIAAALLAGLAVRLWAERKRRRAAAGQPAPAPEDESLVDLNEKFLRLAESAEGGPRDRLALVRTYSPADTAMLRSLLDAEGIPSYCDSNYLANYYAGVSVKGIADETIQVFADDAAAAREIAAAFIADLEQGPATARLLPELL
jgi:hypothetical protein